MIKTFIKGLVFGAGFSISILVIFFFAKELLIKDMEEKYDIPKSASSEWHELTDDEQLKKATAIAIVRYTDSDDGSKSAFVEKVYTDKATKLRLKVGDPYPNLRYYPRKDSFRERTGVLVLFRDSPPVEQSTLYLYDDRVAAYGDMPIEIAVKIFQEN